MTHDNVTDIVERLNCLHVWPQSIASTYADTLTPRQIERLYDVGNVATEAADTIATLRKQLENAREALRPFAEVAEWAIRNDHELDDFDMLIRYINGPKSGQFAGHLQVQSAQFKQAREALKGQPC